MFIRTNSRVCRASGPREAVHSNQGSVEHLFQMTFYWRAARRAPAIQGSSEVLQWFLQDPDGIICSFYSNLKRNEEHCELSLHFQTYAYKRHNFSNYHKLSEFIIIISWKPLVISDI